MKAMAGSPPPSTRASPPPPSEVRIVIPKHAMGMLIGTKGSNFRDIQDIPELNSCNLHQPVPDAGGTLVVKGSVRSTVVAAERVGKIIDASFERNVRLSSGPVRARYERPSIRGRRYEPFQRRNASPPPADPRAGSDHDEPNEDETDDSKRTWKRP